MAQLEKWPAPKMGASSANRMVRSYRAEGAAIGAGLAVVAGTEWDQVKMPDGGNVRALGITALAVHQEGEAIAVTEFGEVVAIADAPVNRCDLVMVGGPTGKLAPIGATAGENYEVIGLALSAAAAQDDEFVVLVMPSRA